MKLFVIGVTLVFGVALMGAHPLDDPSITATTIAATTADSDESDEVLAVEVTDGRTCPFDDTTFTITINILPVKIFNPQKLLNSLNCSTLNYCGNGEERSSCPAFKSNFLSSYKKSLVVSITNSNIAPGLLTAKVHFAPKGSAEMKIRYVKFEKVENIPTDVPKGWDDFNVDANTLKESEMMTSIIEIKSRDFQDKNVSTIAERHAQRVSDWVKIILGAEELKGNILALEQKDGEWTIFDDKLILTLGEKWSRDTFEDKIKKFNDEYQHFCVCQRQESEKCRSDPRYQKYLPFFDTESLACKLATDD